MTKLSLVAASAAVAVALLASGCKTSPPGPVDANVKPDVKIETSGLRMPSGVALGQLQLISEARLTKLYVHMTGIGDTAETSKVLFPPETAAALGITNRQMNRRFMDTIAQAKRFELYDDSTTVVREFDVNIDGLVTDSRQEWLDLGAMRKTMTTVRLSVQMKDWTTGQLLLPAPVNVEARYGDAQGEGTLLTKSTSINSPEVQRAAANDYARALTKALTQAAARIEKVMRPVGKVIAVDAKTVSMIGGSRHGFQTDDEVVIFRAEFTRAGTRDILKRTVPVAVVQCDGVGTETSECDIRRLAPDLKPQVGDYAVLTDKSANSPRQE